MIDLTIYGKTSSTYGYMKTMINKFTEDAGININVNEVNDVSTFIDHRIMSIPAYQLNGTIEERGSKTMNEFLRELQIAILKKANFGNMKQIFVPTDFSEASDNAITYAVNLGKKVNAAIKLVHIYRPDPIVYEGNYVNPEMIEIREKRLSNLAEELNKKWIGEQDATVLDSEVRVGFAYDQIQILSEENPHGWIVMGSSGSSKTIKNIFGSVSTAVAKDSEGPVFIIPPSATYSPLKKIVYCSLDDRLDGEAMESILEIAGLYNAEIHIIHVQEDKDSYVEFDLLNSIKNNYPKSKLRYVCLSGKDKVALVNNYCEENEINLLAMVRGKRSVFGELFHKSFTKQMTITAEIPLLILHK